MKTFCLLTAAWIAGTGLAVAQAPAAPTAAPRADAHLVVGWQNLHKDQPQTHYNDWINSIFYGGAGAGWYWTEHLKTQVDFGAGTRGEQYRFQEFVVNGVPAYESSRVSVRQQSVAIGQHYQFFHNQWFHPHVGAGVDLARETSTREYESVIVFDPVSRTPREVSPARVERDVHRFVARPFAETGFKAYMTRRAFFTADSRVMFRQGIDEVLFRFGFGVDF